MKRLFRALDVFLGVSLFSSICMVLLTALPLPSQAAETVRGAGQAITERRTAADFDAIEVAGDFEVVVRQSASTAIDVRAEPNLMPYLETVVTENRKLVIRWKRFTTINAGVRPVVSVQVVQLRAIESSGSGLVRIEGLTTPKLAASLSGSGDIRLTGLSSDDLHLSIAGSGDVTAAGQSKQLSVRIAGSGDVRSQELKAEEVTVSIAGSGDARVHAEKSLRVAIAGSGDVTYSGAASVKSSIAGSGSVHKR